MYKAPLILTGDNSDPTGTNYKILGYHKKITLVVGEAKYIEYYQNFDGVTYSGLVVKEERTYIRSAIGMVEWRDMTICFYATDGTVGFTKVTRKFYDTMGSIDEGIARRNNIIAQAKLVVLMSIGQANGFDLLSSVQSEMFLYVGGYHQPLLDAIAASTKPYMSSALKANLTTVLTF
jgi:hypothetical protein